MIKISQGIIVEGKYDKIKLSNFIDGNIITTDGFGIFKNKEKQEMIRKIADKKGIIILTDSDSAGFVIRGHLTGIVPADKIINVFVPEIKGKEKRKDKPSAQGLLGVEGLSEETIVEAFKKAGVNIDGSKCIKSTEEQITSFDFYSLGLSGNNNSSAKRERILKKLDLPSGMSSKQMLTALNALYSREEFYRLIIAEKGDKNEE